jgi:hypothetical protein
LARFFPYIPLIFYLQTEYWWCFLFTLTNLKCLELKEGEENENSERANNKCSILRIVWRFGVEGEVGEEVVEGRIGGSERLTTNFKL